MASRSRKSGGKGFFGGVFAILLIGAFIIWFFNVPSNPNVHDIPGILKSKSQTLDSWMRNCVPNAVKGDFSHCSLTDNVQGGGSSPEPGTGTTPGGSTPTETEQVLNTLTVSAPESVKYNRNEWKHWIPQGSACWDTRDQVLYNEAQKDSTLILVDGNGKQVSDVKSACSVKAGTWLDPYSGATFTNPKDLDVDHVVPLSYAAQHGAQGWDAQKKQQYANDLSNNYHLRAVKASENRAKGDKGPSQWKPSDQNDYCNYATSWVLISKNYGLTVSPADKTTLQDMLKTCK